MLFVIFYSLDYHKVHNFNIKNLTTLWLVVFLIQNAPHSEYFQFDLLIGNSYKQKLKYQKDAAKFAKLVHLNTPSPPS